MTSTRTDRRRTREDRLSGYKRYWDEERETMPAAQREKIILERVHHQLHYAYERLPFYRRHYDAHGFHPDQVRSLEDFTSRVPVITKKMLVADQAEHPPFGSYAGVERADLGRIHGSSGTSGTPAMYGVSMCDWRRAGEASAAGLWCAGFRPDDVAQVTFHFSLFFGGWGNVQALELLGACVFPPGAMVPTDQQLELLDTLRCDALVAPRPTWYTWPAAASRSGATRRRQRWDSPWSAASLAVRSRPCARR